MASSWFSRVLNLSSGQRSFFKFGLPMLLLVVAGSVGLSEFTEVRMKRRDEKVRKFNYEETLQFNTRKKSKPVTLEEAFEKVQADIDVDNWENKRVPRPWSEEMK